MAQNTLTLEVISQESHVMTKEVSRFTAPALEGEVTILPSHIPFFTRLKDGIITYFEDNNSYELAILGGFMDVGLNNHVTILADAAIRVADVNLAKAEAARKQAQETMKQKISEVEFKVAEASLRRALLELKVARRSRPHSVTPLES